MGMKLNYRKMFSVHIFADAVLLALFLRHDSYQIFLAVASLMIGYNLAHLASRSRVWALIIFILISVVICQTSVTAKKAQIDDAFRQELSASNNPTGAVVVDVIHGFKQIVDLRNIPSKIKEKGSYGFFESANYRYLTMGLFLPFMGVSLIMRKPDQESNKKRLRR